MISLRLHNILDYALGFALIFCPWLFQFNDIQSATQVYLLVGSVIIIHSLFTNYEFSMAPVIPLGSHMIIDLFSGLILIVAPAALDYQGLLTIPQELLHYVLGLMIFAGVVMTKPRSEHEREELSLGCSRA